MRFDGKKPWPIQRKKKKNETKLYTGELYKKKTHLKIYGIERELLSAITYIRNWQKPKKYVRQSNYLRFNGRTMPLPNACFFGFTLYDTWYYFFFRLLRVHIECILFNTLSLYFCWKTKLFSENHPCGVSQNILTEGIYENANCFC